MELNKQKQWASFITDYELRGVLEQGKPDYISEDNIRAAFVLLERRIRQSAGLSGHQFGKELIDAAFHPDSGLLQPVSPVGAERAGLHHLLLGIFLYYRSPIAHRPVHHDQQSARQICVLIDHALDLIRKAAEQVINLDDFVGGHEGQILSRQDFRLDIDGDDEEEIVILVGLGPSLDGTKLTPHLASIVLKKSAKSYSRIPCEWISGQSMYGPIKAEARHVTDNQRPDIVVYWTWGESMTLILILRYEVDKYVFALREIPAGMKEPYSGPFEKGFGAHPRQMFSFADVDGDGRAEMIHTLLFDNEDKEKMGYANLDQMEEGNIDVCRVWKWDDQKSRIVQVEERPVFRRYRDESATV